MIPQTRDSRAFHPPLSPVVPVFFLLLLIDLCLEDASGSRTTKSGAWNKKKDVATGRI